MEIPIKIKGCLPKEIEEAYRDISVSVILPIPDDSANEAVRGVEDFVQVVTDNIGTIIIVLTNVHLVWKEIMDWRKLNLENEKLKLNVLRLKLDKEKWKVEKEKYEREKQQLDVDQKNQPQIAIIQQAHGDDMVVPLGVGNELELKAFFDENASNIDVKDIQAILIK